MFPAVNFSNKTIEMTSGVARMYPVASHRDLTKQLLSKYLKLVEKRASFNHSDYPKYAFDLIILRCLTCNCSFNIDVFHQ